MTNVSRNVPWSQQEVALKSFLTECGSITIPMNQRNYCWLPKHIDEFTDDMDDILKANMKMCYGNVIQYKSSDGDKEIWDGQQRIITAILLLLAFRNFLKNIFPHITTDYNQVHADKLINQINAVTELDSNEDFDLDEESTIVLPRVKCVSPKDKLILTRIINDYEPLTNFQNCSFAKDGNGQIQCRLCNEIIGGERNETDFKRHLIKSCKEISDESRNKLKNSDKELGTVKANPMLNAYERLSYYIFHRCATLNDAKERIQLLLHDYIVNVKSCTDLDYVSKLYNFENNRGERMQTIDVVKNYILTNIPDDKKIEIFTMWDELKNQKQHNIYGSEYGYKIFKTAIQIYNKRILVVMAEESDYKQLIDFNDKQITYHNTLGYLDIVKSLYSIMEDINKDRYGRLILHKKKGVTFSWEAYAYTILPKFYTDGCIDSKFIERLVTWQMYMSCFGFKESFNSLRYSHPFSQYLTEYMNKQISKEELNEKIYQILDRAIAPTGTNDEILRNVVKHQQFKNGGIAKIKSILAYIETRTTSSINLFDLDGIDHEHIVSQKCKDILTNGNLISSWGNITLLESKNTENVQTGNRGVKTSMFKKKESYTNSTFSYTRKIVELYPEFFERDNITENPDSVYDTLIQKRKDDIINKCIETIRF
tara:strand:- start:52 stop:2010 length:1959 start_codon:yes stop_codon:yes gene_type:complete